MRALIKNNRGQSLIETSIILGFIAGALFAILKMATLFILILSVDDFLESYILCSVYENSSHCQIQLTQKLNFVNLRFVSLTNQSHVVHLTVYSRFNKTIQRSREYANR